MRRRPRPPLLSPRRSKRGQSLAEFALILPILLALTLVIADFGRLFAAMIGTEAAAREAADYGAFLGSPAWASADAPWTVNGTEMEIRACAALAGQSGFRNDSGACSENPKMTWELLPPSGSGGECGDRLGLVDPCIVHVRVVFDFQPVIPLGRLLGLLGGGGDSDSGTVIIVRDSWFAVSDLSGS